LEERVGPPTEFVNFKGWVKKIGEHHMGLRRRFLVVDGTEVHYYRKPDQPMPKGSIHLSAFSASRFVEKGDMIYSIKEVRASKPHGVVLSIVEEKRSYCFFCESEEDRHSLLNALRNNVEMIRRSVEGTVAMLSAVCNLGNVSSIGRLKMALRRRHHSRADDSWKESCPLSKLLSALSNPVDPLNALRLIYFRYKKTIERESLAAEGTACTSSSGPIGPTTGPTSGPTTGLGSIFDFQEPGTGWTILMRSIDLENDDIALWIIRHGASVNVGDVDDDTALIIASRLGRSRVVRALLQYGADRTLCNRWDECASSEAPGWPEIEDMLRSFFPVRSMPMIESEIDMAETELRSACFGSVTGDAFLSRGSAFDVDTIGLLPPRCRGSRRYTDGAEDVFDSEEPSSTLGVPRMVSMVDDDDDDDDDDDNDSDWMSEEDDDLEQFENSCRVEKKESPRPLEADHHLLWDSDDSEFEDTLEPQVEAHVGPTKAQKMSSD
jgi:hypothetical protein